MEKSLNSSISQAALEERLKRVREAVSEAAVGAGRQPEAVRIMAVTKYVEAGTICRALDAGVDLIGENREQSLSGKYHAIARDDVDIHFIGRLQTNKAARVVRMVSTVQSLDSLRLAAELDRQAAAYQKRLDVLVEVNIGHDPGKAGVDPDEAAAFVEQLRGYPALCVRGLMAVLPLGDSEAVNEGYFSRMNALYVDIQAKNGDNVNVDCLSMGMSGDYVQAVRQGSTLVRLGTALFG